VIARTCCLFLALLVGAPALAQSGRRPSAGPAADGEVRLEADEVRLSVRVHDAGGRPVGGLAREDFIVAERGERQTLVSFAAEKAPLDLVLVLDASPDVYSDLGAPPKGDRPVPRVQEPSIVDKILGPPPQPPPIRIDRLADLAFARRVARELIGRLRPGDRVSVLQVSEKVELLQDWTE
jgi:hypothetical protein